MTPFGERIRALRQRRGLQLKHMAEALNISSAYLSALEHGRKGTPSPMLVRQICGYFGIFWDEAEELERLARLSDPKVVIDTAGLPAQATLAANLLARRIRHLDAQAVDHLLALLDAEPNWNTPPGMSPTPGQAPGQANDQGKG